MRKAVIISATRTAIGKFGGSLKDMTSQHLGSVVIRETAKQAGVKPEEVDEILIGNVLSGGQGMNIARQSAINAGFPAKTPCYCVNKVCGSGLKSVILGTQSIMLEDSDIVIAGGTESMSTALYALKKARWGMRMGNDEVIDMMIYDGLWDIFNNVHMGITAENVAAKYGITREEQDEFSARSQNKAEAAIKAGKFREEIVPVQIQQPKGDAVIFDTDEFPRFGTTKEKLANLKPAFKKDGTVTAGNASGINDGAAAVLLMSEEKAREKGLSPLATIESYGFCGLPPEIMGMGPVCATGKTLARAGLSLDDIDLIEVNEAFAAQSIAVGKELGLDMDRVNVNGGAIALGHPIGASGTRILVTLLFEMMRRKSKYGLATLCIGGGMGIAMIIRR